MKIVALLNNIRSLHNVGSIFRTTDGAGVSKIFLCGQTGFPPRDEIAKTALGAEKTVPWEYWIDACECAEALRKKGFQLVALEKTDRSIDYRSFKPTYPVCLVVGHEIGGVEEKMLDLCDAVIEIPMRGQKQSLNVSVAFGVAVYQLAEGI